MTVESELSVVSALAAALQMRERPVPESPLLTSLRIRIAATLRTEAGELARRWDVRVEGIALRDSERAPDADRLFLATALIESLATVLASGGAIADGMVALGMAFGTEAFENGASLHHTLKGLDLLNAITLYAVETAIGEEISAELSLSDGIRLCRRFQQGSSLLTLGVAKGYTQAANEEMRNHFRHLRHDLRNPLGTIKSVLALMDDETLPLAERSNPRFRAMAKRNARSLGELIGERLGDAEAVLPAHVLQTVSLRTIACTVRRDLRAEAIARKTVILVAGTKIRMQVDAVGLELILHELLVAGLQESLDGDELNISFGEPDGDQATVCLRRIPERPLISRNETIKRLNALAIQLGATLDTSDQLVVSFFAQRQKLDTSLVDVSEQIRAGSDVAATLRSVQGNARHDVRSTREHEHGQTSSL